MNRLLVKLAVLVALMAAVAAFATNVKFEWTDVTPGGSDGFELLYVNAGVTNTVSTVSTNVTVTNMTAGTSVVAVRATSTNGLKSDYSAPLSVKVPATPSTIHLQLN